MVGGSNPFGPTFYFTMRDIEKLKEEYHNCILCPELAKNRTNVVFGEGNPERAKVLIIGEAPGKSEDIQGKPFVGRSGQILNELLKSAGLSREDTYITNTILCRPPNNRNPKPEELERCKKRLDTFIKLLNPNVIITLGNFATQYILETKKGISQLRGKLFEKDGRKILPMFHPAALIYSGNNPERRALMEGDFRAAAKVVREAAEQKRLDEAF